METGMVWWNELRTPDEDAAISFYSRLVGWQPFKVGGADGSEGAGNSSDTYTVWTKGLNQAGGMLKTTTRLPAGAAIWLPFISVADVDACARQAVELGGGVIEAPFDVPNAGRFAVLRDPHGAVFGVGKPEMEEEIEESEPQYPPI